MASVSPVSPDIFTLDHVSLSSFTALVILTTFVATRRCRCLLQSVRMQLPDCLPWRMLPRMHQAVMNRLLHIKRVINKYTACCTLLDNLQSAHYHLLKAKQQAREVFWVDIPMPEKLDENIQAQVTLLHMIADHKAHIVREMEYAQNELLVPVVYPDGIEISSDVGEELHDPTKDVSGLHLANAPPS